MTRKLTKMVLSLAVIGALVPLMGSDCDDRGYYGAFDYGYGWLPSFGGGYGYYESGYEESYYEESYDYGYDDYYYDDFYDDGWWWKKK